MPDHPRNLLMIIADQFRADLLTGSLAPVVPTPNLDRLMSEGTTYLNHHTVTVPCGPSRASLLTGQYAMNHRSIHNGAPLSRHFPTLATELRKAGREPLLFGYTDTQADPTGLSPADPAHESYTAPMPGFTEVQEMRDEAWAWLAHLRARGYDVPDAGATDFDRLYRPEGGVLGAPALYDAEDSDTAFLTDQTLGQLDVRKGHPWTALVTYIRPHPPMVAPDPWHAHVPEDAVPSPSTKQGDHPFFDGFHAEPYGAGLFHGFDGDMTSMTPDCVRKLRRAYFGLVAEVDHHIGRLLDWLDATGQAEDTLVVFTSDHGEMLGDLGLWGKLAVQRQASHIPLLMRGPGAAGGPAAVGGTVTAPTESIDVTPTLLRRLGLTPPGQMNGQDLAARDEYGVVMCDVDLGGPDGLGRFEAAWNAPSEACRAAILETQDWRYVHFSGGQPPMLFDLGSDPACTTDRAPANPKIVEDLKTRLLNHRMQRAAVLFPR